MPACFAMAVRKGAVTWSMAQPVRLAPRRGAGIYTGEGRRPNVGRKPAFGRLSDFAALQTSIRQEMKGRPHPRRIFYAMVRRSSSGCGGALETHTTGGSNHLP